MKSSRSVTLAIFFLLLAASCTAAPAADLEPTATLPESTVPPTAVPTDTSLPTEIPPSPTPTLTQVPTETATSLPTHTATSTSVPSPTAPPPPPSTSTPALEPITFRMEGLGTRKETVEAHRPVIVEWRWGVSKPELVSDNLNAITFKVTIDGTVVATGDLAERRSAVQEQHTEDGRDVWLTYWSYPMGAFASGSFHWLEVEWHFSSAVTDGGDIDGDGQLDLYGPGVLGVQRWEVTVR